MTKTGMEVALIGRIGAEPSLRHVGEQSKALLDFGVAVDLGGEKPEWVKVTAWEGLADEMAERLKSGIEVYIEGKGQLQHWTAESGEPRTTFRVTASLVQPLGQLGKKRPQRQRYERPVEPARKPFDRGPVFE